MDSDRELIEALVAYSGKSASAIAREAGVAVSTLTRPLNHEVDYELSKKTIDKLRRAFPKFPGFRAFADLPIQRSDIDYLKVNVLPTFAGMGGGGNGDDDEGSALVPRALIEDVLRGRPSDFLLINVRGDSMEPDFQHDDQILVDCRDVSPSQPGYFALWDGEWGEYVVKNVERSRGGEIRIFSSNPKYKAECVDAETTRIIGRPVWFARQL